MSEGERQLVARLLAALGAADSGVEVGPGDDAAVLPPVPERTVLTVDAQREDVHFRRSWLPPEELGRRAVAVAASDIGAMGARPRWSLCAASAPSATDRTWLERLFVGLGEGGRELGCPVVGGDLSVSSGVELVVTVGGSLAAGQRPLLRSGARPGQGCWVLGRLGRAAAGRALLTAGRRFPGDDTLLAAYRHPRPLLALGAEIGSSALAAAMMDVSDGLAIDLIRMCAASEVGVEVRAAALEDAGLAAVAAELDADPVAWQLTGGDDYALLVAVEPSSETALAQLAETHGVRAHRVGGFTDRPGERVLVGTDGKSHSLEGGWDPFVESGDG